MPIFAEGRLGTRRRRGGATCERLSFVPTASAPLRRGRAGSRRRDPVDGPRASPRRSPLNRDVGCERSLTILTLHSGSAKPDPGFGARVLGHVANEANSAERQFWGVTVVSQSVSECVLHPAIRDGLGGSDASKLWDASGSGQPSVV
jgi:hypothetical protein